MDDLRDRFGRLDRIDAPDLWNEAVERAAELGVVARRPISRAFVLIAAALLLVALAGAIAIGVRLIRPVPPDPSSVRYSNGMIVGAGPVRCARRHRPEPRARHATSWPLHRTASSGTYLPTETAWSSDGQRLAYGVWRECGGCLDQSEPAGAWVYDVATGVDAADR